jgi:hypothetical protein
MGKDCMPDPVTGITIATAVGIAAKQAQDFIAAAAGHPGESIGTILGGLAKRRLENAEKVAYGAHLTMLNIGLKPDEIPLRVLIPAFEHASVEEDPSMQERWANLLANASDPRHQIEITPSFNPILAELTPAQAKMFDAIFREAAKRCRNGATLFIEDIAYSTYDLGHIHHREIVVPIHGPNAPETITAQSRSIIDVLARTGLLDVRTDDNTIYQGTDLSGRRPLLYTVSMLGLVFYHACQPPRRPAETGPPTS